MLVEIREKPHTEVLDVPGCLLPAPMLLEPGLRVPPGHSDIDAGLPVDVVGIPAPEPLIREHLRSELDNVHRMRAIPVRPIGHPCRQAPKPQLVEQLGRPPAASCFFGGSAHGGPGRVSHGPWWTTPPALVSMGGATRGMTPREVRTEGPLVPSRNRNLLRFVDLLPASIHDRHRRVAPMGIDPRVVQCPPSSVEQAPAIPRPGSLPYRPNQAQARTVSGTLIRSAIPRAVRDRVLSSRDVPGRLVAWQGP